jgi:hypothetical protein
MNIRMIAVACNVLLLFGCVAPPTVPETAYDNMAKFLAQLAQQVQDSMAPGKDKPQDFQIVVTQAAYPIGTVLRPSSTIPIDYSACAPTTAVNKSPMPSAFPTYKLSKSVAANFGLDNKVIRELVDFGVDYKNSSNIDLTVENPMIQSLADRELATIANGPNCISAISPGPVWVVRGYVLGKRNFSLQRQNSITSSAKVTDIGSFQISANPGSPIVSIADTGESSFLQIVSQLSAPTVMRTVAATSGTSSASVTTAPGEITTTTAGGTTTTTTGRGAASADTSRGPSQPTGTQVFTTFEKPKPIADTTGRIYVQMDKNDRSGKSDAVMRALTEDTSLRVEPRVEAIKHENMPSRPTVRYFNAEDSTLAERVLAQFKKVFPDAIAVPVTLPAPRGQVEVWLPKANE